MNLTITARRFRLPEDLREYIEAKAKKLNRYYQGIIDLEIILGWEKLMRYTEIKMNVNTRQLVVKESAEELRKSFDLALDRAERQLKKFKEKLQTTEKDKVHTA
ncbi:MAG: ribosome-associated translation inhibitor RaiA [Calditrichaeota bacterium]|nr:MAG: ribosome-associated translation inhibitor RaiA [Calditrichota bacterium]